MNMLSAWIRASRLPSQSYIFLPLLAGQAFYLMQGGAIDWSVFAIVHVYGLFVQLYIVYANDYADEETDALNSTYTLFSGGSRVLVNGGLRAKSLRNAAIATALLCIGAGILLASAYGRSLTVPLAGAGIILLWMYSYSPLKLSYRGGGEFLQMIGVGLVLPLLGFYAQSGRIASFPWPLLLTILPTQLACAVATSLPDEPSDRMSRKRSASVVWGSTRAKLIIMALNGVSILSFALLGWGPRIDDALSCFIGVPIIAVAAQLPLLRSEPGSLRLTLFVALSVLVTLSLMVALIVAAALSAVHP